MWFDSHCHIQETYRPDGDDADDALEQAAAGSVGALVCVGTDAETSEQALAVAALAGRRRAAGQAAPETWATVGLHPHEAVAGVASVQAVLERALAAGAPVVAVGECGLDYHYDHSPRPVQRQAFADQVELARRHDLTLVVHSRQAWDDTLAVLGRSRPQRVVLHCFTGGPDEARRCLDLGAFLSFSGIVTFKGADDVRAAAALCPLDRLLIETDAPFLAPAPHRGATNRPALVSVVGEAVAAVKGLSVDQVIESTDTAARAAFRLDSPAR